MRYGLRGDDGETYWVDEAHLGSEQAAPPPPQTAAPKSSKPPLQKGQRVVLLKGDTSGEVFWTGQSKYGAGMRYGVRADDGQTHWVDDHELRADGPVPSVDRAASSSRRAPASDRPPLEELPRDPGDGLVGDPHDDAPLPGDDELPPEAFLDVADDAWPPDGYDDLPPDDAP